MVLSTDQIAAIVGALVALVALVQDIINLIKTLTGG
jgi:hypothetical protein